MDAIITAGGVPQVGEPLFEFTQGKSKALLDVGGKPMIQWVLDALAGSQKIENIIIIGLDADNGLRGKKIHSYLPNQGAMLDNIKAGLAAQDAINPQASHVLLVSSDIPTITSEMVDWVIDTALQTDEDAYYNVISRQTMETRFPGSKRTYTHLKDIELCGGDMNLIKTSIKSNDELWEKIIASRKSVLKQAALMGYVTLILFMLRQLTLESAIKRITSRVGITGRAIICPYAEVGMDVDKPFQLEMVRADLVKRSPLTT